MVGESLPHGWCWATLGEVADPKGRAIVSGPFGSNIGTKFFVEKGVPVIRGNNLTTDMRRFLDEGFVFVTESKADELRNCEAIADDLVFTAAGSLGQVGLIPRDSAFGRYIISNKQLRARVDKARLDPLFAFYWFSSKEMVAYIQQRNTGSSVPLINLGVLRSLPIRVPPLAEQSAIVRVLGTLDDKIELNRRMNETLESMARALFKSWFVDFDPSRAKAEGLDASPSSPIAALFPDSLEDSEIGEVPKGWRIGVLDDITEFVLGGDWGTDTHTEETSELAFCIRGADIPELQSGGFGKMPTRFLRKSSLAKRQLRDGDLVVEISGGSPTQSTGRPVLISEALLLRREYPLVCSNFCRLLRLKDRVASKFVYTWLRWLYDNDALLQFETGTTGIKNFAFTLFSSSFRVVIPPPDVLKVFDSLTLPLFRQQQTHAAERETLAALRNTLLPRLMSGDLRIKDVERIVGAQT
jgi:type I restriction enzyme S subunit